MKVTTRIIADVDPKVKEKLMEIAKDKNVSMASAICEMIEKEWKKIK